MDSIAYSVKLADLSYQCVTIMPKAIEKTISTTVMTTVRMKKNAYMPLPFRRIVLSTLSRRFRCSLLDCCTSSLIAAKWPVRRTRC